MSDKNKTRDRFEKTRRKRIKAEILADKRAKYKKILLKEIQLEQELEKAKKKQ